MLFAIIWEQPRAKSYFIMCHCLIMTTKGLKLVGNETVNYTFTTASFLRKFSVSNKFALVINEKGKNDFDSGTALQGNVTMVIRYRRMGQPVSTM